MATAMLEVRNLVVEVATAAEATVLVDSVSFSVDAGGTLAIVGESGCGKSMTALALMRILPEPAVRIGAGAIYLDGEELVGATEARMCQLRSTGISIIFQDPIASLNPIHTAGEQIVEIIRLHRRVSRADARKQAIDLLRSVQLPDAEHRIDYHPHRLSGGMCQRVMIAMALACKPKVLIADEPTTALDTTVQAQVMALLKRAQRENGSAMLLITHNIAVAAEAAETVAVMYAGRIVESGPVHAVFRSPLHPYTRGLLGAIPKLESESDGIPKLVEIGGNVPRPGTLMSGCAFAPRCPRVRARCNTETPILSSAGGARTLSCFYPHEEAPQ